MKLIPGLALLFGAAATLPAQTITTVFGSSTNVHTSATAVRPSISYDMTVLNPAGIVLNRFDLNCGYTGLAGQIEFWFTDVGGTYVGNLSSPPPGTWKLRSTANVVTAGNDLNTIAILQKPIVLPPGTYGVTIIYKGCTSRYFTTGSTTYANADVTITVGALQQNAFLGTVNPCIGSLRMYYGPLNANVVDFTADVNSGPGPLLVNFADRSYLTAPVTSWEWDFDNDTIIDSTLQNPLTVFALCGDYSVRLRVTTTTGPIERVWTNLIHVDPLQADFTALPDAGVPPLLGVQFNDISSGAPLAWSWDFDGDGLSDSIQQNPTSSFGPGSHPVTLTVTNGCRTSSVTKRITAATDTIASAYNASSNIVTLNVMNMFDVAVTAAEKLVVVALDVNALSPLGNRVEIEVYLTNGTWVGKHLMPNEWRLVAVGWASSLGANQATKIMLDRPILLLPNTSYGVGIRYLNCHSYVQSAASTVPVSNADMAWTFGADSASHNGVFVNPTIRQPRGFSGAMHYVKPSQWAVGAFNWFAHGCAGALGVPRLRPGLGQRLQLGTTTTTQITNMPQSSGFVLLGFSNTVSTFGPLPLSLQGFGMPNCFGRVSADATVFQFGVNNVANYSLTLPNDPTLAGIPLFMQSLVLDPAANSFGAVMLDAAAGVVGNF